MERCFIDRMRSRRTLNWKWPWQTFQGEDKPRLACNRGRDIQNLEWFKVFLAQQCPYLKKLQLCNNETLIDDNILQYLTSTCCKLKNIEFLQKFPLFTEDFVWFVYSQCSYIFSWCDAFGWSIINAGCVIDFTGSDISNAVLTGLGKKKVWNQSV